ncbi:MAG: metal ABC transporter solute-binding protein, Zn/Mn family [Desulfosalsimonas sp.]
MMMKKNLYIVFALLLVAVCGILQSEAESREKRLNVIVSILPQKYFVEQIAADRVNVEVMVKPGSHPATYEPAPSQMAAISKCDLYFAVGVPFEKAWLKKFRSANPDMRIVRTDAWIEKLPVERNGHSTDSVHEHGSGDPHIWLSPPLVMVQARHILTALVSADAENAQFYESRYRKFISETAELDEKLRSLFPPSETKPEFMVFHPSWGYFADAYGLRQTAVEKEGKSPKTAEIKRLVEYARKKKIKVLLVQPQISSRTAEIIAREIGGKTVTADPLAENWSENLLKVAASISNAAR